MDTRGGETQDTDLTWGGGRSGGLTGHGDRTGQEASRAAPVLGAMAGQGTRVAMAERGACAAMAERGAWVARVDPGTQEAMADQGAWAGLFVLVESSVTRGYTGEPGTRKRGGVELSSGYFICNTEQRSRET